MLLVVVVVSGVLAQSRPAAIEISCSKMDIEVGERLVLNLQFLFDRPLQYSETNEPIQGIEHHATVRIEHDGDGFSIDELPLYDPLS